MKFDIDAIVFDLDGTLIDSRDDIANSLNQTFREIGYDPLPMEVIASFVGNGVNPLIHRAVEAAGHIEREKEVLTLFRQRYWEHLLDNTRLFEGVAETLPKLEGRYAMGLVSNKPEIFTKRIVGELGLKKYFNESVYGGDTLPVKKPDPLPLLHAAAHLGVSAEESLMIGDSKSDVKAARAAGFQIVCMSYGYNHGEDIRNYDPDLVVDSMAELKDVL